MGNDASSFDLTQDGCDNFQFQIEGKAPKSQPSREERYASANLAFTYSQNDIANSTTRDPGRVTPSEKSTTGDGKSSEVAVSTRSGSQDGSHVLDGTNNGAVAKTKIDGQRQLDWPVERSIYLGRNLDQMDMSLWQNEGDNVDAEAQTTLDYLLGRAEASAPASLDGSGHLHHRVRVLQVAPDHASIEDLDDKDGHGWKLSLDNFTAKKTIGADRKKLPKRLRSYYKQQDELITQYEELQLEIDDVMENTRAIEKLRKLASRVAKITFLINILLLIAKAVAVALSGSISIISSLLDSAMDLVSGVVIWWTSRAVKKRNPYVYPQGRTKLEPLGIVILAVIMAVCSLQIIKESIDKIIGLANGTADLPNMDVATIAIAGSTIVVKFVLFIISRRINHPGIKVLAQDHRNDVLSNAIALICGYVGSQELRDKTQINELGHVDPLGAVLISIYIFITWSITAYTQIKLLTGYTAKPEFLSKITWICLNHHKNIDKVETVRAFHFGNNFLVEVHIVLPQNLTLQEAHDIGEPLQQKLERLPNVERAFVHVDYEAHHDPKTEHKTV